MEKKPYSFKERTAMRHIFTQLKSLVEKNSQQGESDEIRFREKILKKDLETDNIRNDILLAQLKHQKLNSFVTIGYTNNPTNTDGFVYMPWQLAPPAIYIHFQNYGEHVTKTQDGFIHEYLTYYFITHTGQASKVHHIQELARDTFSPEEFLQLPIQTSPTPEESTLPSTIEEMRGITRYINAWYKPYQENIGINMTNISNVK